MPTWNDLGEYCEWLGREARRREVAAEPLPVDPSTGYPTYSALASRYGLTVHRNSRLYAPSTRRKLRERWDAEQRGERAA